ncbi:hypothetical protein CHCC14814_0502 [Bacillus paralicheniformis]|nr:hypothetical protein CHCC14814_0502 [Bacillus paralicheniformis]
MFLSGCIEGVVRFKGRAAVNYRATVAGTQASPYKNKKKSRQ